MSFELNQLAFTEEATLHLEHPSTNAPLYAPVKKGEDAESKPVQIVLKGSASSTYSRALDTMIKAKNKIEKTRQLTLKESRDMNTEFLATISVVANNLTLDGEAVDNTDAFRKLYADSRFDWIKTQVNEFLGSVDAFLK